MVCVGFPIDFTDLNYGLNEIMQMKPLKYQKHISEFTEDGLKVYDNSSKEIGFIAQDLYRIIPEAVYKPDDDSKELWGINYGELTAVLVKGIQEQQAEIQQLQDLVNQQQQTIEQLQNTIAQMQIQINNSK